jgi:rhodanese-related sulfurtransferase
LHVLNNFEMIISNKTALILLFSLMIPFVVGAQTKRVTPDDFEKLLNDAKNKTILDVRTQSEYEQGHIHNAQIIDYYSNDFKSKLETLDKSKPVFVYCAAGSRSAGAAKILSSMGFKEIYDMQGGFNSWKQRKKPVE